MGAWLASSDGMSEVTAVERFTFGRPLDPSRDVTLIPLAARPATALAGRILLSVIFLVSGSAKLFDPGGTAAHMTAAGIPNAEVLLWIAAAAEILGGLALATGFLTRVAALGLIVFLIPTTLAFHHFWNLTGMDRVIQASNFFKNLGIAGGLALLVAYGAGRFSLDYLVRRPMQP